MYLAIVSLARERPGVAGLDADVLVDLLWAITEPADAVEHIAARTGPAHADVGLYLSAPSPDAAEQAARVLLERATRIAPALRGWHIRPADPANDSPAGGRET